MKVDKRNGEREKTPMTSRGHQEHSTFIKTFRKREELKYAAIESMNSTGALYTPYKEKFHSPIRIEDNAHHHRTVNKKKEKAEKMEVEERRKV